MYETQTQFYDKYWLFCDKCVCSVTSVVSSVTSVVCFVTSVSVLWQVSSLLWQVLSVLWQVLTFVTRLDKLRSLYGEHSSGCRTSRNTQLECSPKTEFQNHEYGRYCSIPHYPHTMYSQHDKSRFRPTLTETATRPTKSRRCGAEIVVSYYALAMRCYKGYYF